MPQPNIAIDLGTANTTAFLRGKGIVFSESTAVCYDAYTDEVVCIGDPAAEMFEKAPESLIPVKPVVGGMVSDFSATVDILSQVISRICKNNIFRPNVIISVPSAVTSLERKAITEAACTSGAGKVYVIDEPVVSALGAGLDIENPHGVMVLDLGAGTSDIAVITMGTVAYCCNLQVCGDSMDEAIAQYVRRNKAIDIGLPTAKKIKHTVGCAYKRSEELEMFCVGKDHITGMPVTFEISSDEIYEALKDSIDAIFAGIVRVLEELPPELYSDVCSEGIIITGGLARMPGMDKELSRRLSIKVKPAADPEHCAAKGAGYVLRNMKRLEDHGYSFRMKEIVG